MMLRLLSVLIVLTPGLSLAQNDLPQMPQELPVPHKAAPPTPIEPQPTPQQTPQAVPNMPQQLPQAAPSVPEGSDAFMLECRTNRTRLAFVIDLKRRVAENVSSYPQSTGAVFERDSEYVLTFLEPAAIEFFISRYTGRMTAVVDGVQVVVTGVCRKGHAQTLF